jgi:D-alanyl-D-alanine carboxypeptidase/D-alanyl-D-alanine-endopeptidase (penicillin-binding protein 4)
VVLAVITLTAATAAMALNRQPVARAVDAGRVTTPVLSARRVPELLVAPAQQQRLSADLSAWLAPSPPDSCLVVDHNDEALFEHNPSRPLPGASTQKLATATALLQALGPDAHLETQVVTAAPVGDGGVVRGDVFLVGGGDSLLATREWRNRFTSRPRTINDIEQLSQAIVDAGVTRINGAVVGDATRYDGVKYHPAWPDRFEAQGAIGPISGLMVNDGFALTPPDDPGPSSPPPDQGQHAASILTFQLEARGVKVGQPPRSGRAPQGAREVASLPSLSIGEMVEEMLSDSDNETAEAAIKELGLTVSGEGSWEAGTAAVSQLLGDTDIPLEDVRVVDGSGLSLDNRVTCDVLVELLTHPETGDELREGLAVAGETGTLSELWKGTPVEGRLRAKTGTLRNVTALAGEVELREGGSLTFAYIATVPDPGPIDPTQVNLLALGDTLVGFREEIDLAPLEPTPAVTG